MTQFLHLGLTVEQVIERVTLTPTKVFKFPEKIGTLEPGVTADVTVIDLQQGNFELIDQQKNKRTARQKFVPVATVHGGTLTKIDPAVHEVAYAGLKTVAALSESARGVVRLRAREPMHRYLIRGHRVGCGPCDSTRSGSHDRA